MANDLDVHQLGELPRDAVARLAEKEAGGDRERAMRVAVQQMQQAPNPSPSPDPRPRPIHYLAIQVGSALTRVTQQHADCSAPALAIRGGNPKRGGMLQIQMINVFRLLLYIATVVVVVWFVEEIVGRAILPRIKQVGAIVIVLLILVFALENFPCDQFYVHRLPNEPHRRPDSRVAARVRVAYMRRLYGVNRLDALSPGIRATALAC